MNYSKQRELILQTVLQNPIHPTADQVYNQVRRQNPKISLGTVYRNLNFLAEMGKIKKISMPVGSDRFDGRLDEHYHAACACCGQVFDLEWEALRQLDGWMRSRPPPSRGCFATARWSDFIGKGKNTGWN